MSKHLNFTLVGTSKSGLTKIWTITSLGGVPLGEIKWFSHWRKYTMYPSPYTVWDDGCLDEVSEFIKAVNISERES